MDNFTAIRNGLLEHIRAGKICPFDLGIYTFLQLTMDWETGICFTNARSIAVQFGSTVSAKDVRQSLYRLRQKRYVNYREGDGSRGSYDVLIHKARPTVGRHVGMQLNAFAIGSLDAPVYDLHNNDATVKRLSENSVTTVIGPLQDLKTLQDVQDVKTKSKPSGATAPCDELADSVSSIYEAYPRKVGKQAALKSIHKAIIRQAKEKGCPPKEAAEFIYSQVVKFAASPAGQRGTYTPHPATWMNAGRYSDDPGEWHSTTNTRNHNSLSERNQALLKRIEGIQ
jgi:hypothetical protein